MLSAVFWSTIFTHIKGTRVRTTKQNMRTNLFLNFCEEFGFKIAKNIKQSTHEATAGSSSIIDHMAYGWIVNGGCEEHNESLKDIGVTVKDDSLNHASEDKHHLCVTEVDLTDPDLGPP